MTEGKFRYTAAEFDWVRDNGPKHEWATRPIWTDFQTLFRPVPWNRFRTFVQRVRGGATFQPLGPEAPAIPGPEQPDIEKISRETRDEMRRAFDANLLRALKKEKAMTDAILDAMYEVAPTVPKVVLPHPRKIITTDHKSQTAVLLLSDLHVGARVDPDEVGGLGEYSYPIFRERMERMREAIRSIVAHHRMSHPVKNLVVAMLGDLIENVTIFAAQGELVDLDLMAQVLAVVGDIIELLIGLLDTFETISVVSVTGNHGRIGRKGEHKRHINWDYLISMVLAKRFENEPRIRFEVPKAPFAIVNIEGYNWLFRHGDNIKSWAGIPWYGLERSTGKWIAMEARQARVLHYAASGHLHQLASIPYAGVEIIVNGSVVGTTTFSVEVIEGLARPMQFFGFVHPKYGLAGRYHLVLDSPREFLKAA